MRLDSKVASVQVALVVVHVQGSVVGVSGERDPAETDQAAGSARNKQILSSASEPIMRVSARVSACVSACEEG